nr:hypothetical protein [Tanacetum cinerariifolium]
MHHEGPCTVNCGNCKRVSHMTRDFKATVAATSLRSPIGNQTGVTCYESRLEIRRALLAMSVEEKDIIELEGTNGAIKFEMKKRKYSSCARHMGEITRKITV